MLFLQKRSIQSKNGHSHRTLIKPHSIFNIPIWNYAINKLLCHLIGFWKVILHSIVRNVLMLFHSTNVLKHIQKIQCHSRRFAYWAIWGVFFNIKMTPRANIRDNNIYIYLIKTCLLIRSSVSVSYLFTYICCDSFRKTINHKWVVMYDVLNDRVIF